MGQDGSMVGDGIDWPAVAARCLASVGVVPGTDPSDEIAVAQRLINAVEAAKSRAVARLVDVCQAEPAARGDRVRAMRFAADDLALRLELHVHTAKGMVADALAMSEKLPATARAFAEGSLDGLRVGEIAGGLSRLVDPGAPAPATMVRRAGWEPMSRREFFDRRMAAYAATHTPGDTRRAVDRLIIALEPKAAAAREERARAERDVTFRACPDGMGLMVAYLPAEAMAGLQDMLAGVVAHARTVKGEERTAGQLRADILTDWAAAALSTGHVLPHACAEYANGPGASFGRLAGGRGSAPRIRITISAAALAGLTDTPAELAGFGAISAEWARRLIESGLASWEVVPVDDEGRPVTPGCPADEAYRPGAATRRAVQDRDQRCRFPGCTARAELSDLDHTVPHPEGPTHPANLAVLCRRHHLAKTLGAWRLAHERPEPAGPPTRAGKTRRPRFERTGHLTITTRTGRRYTTRPPTLPHDEADGGDDPPPF